MVVIIDYGMGNVGSVQNILRRVGADCRVSSDPAEIAGADQLVLPGVGAFGAGMQRLRDRDILGVLWERVMVQRVPLLGVCLGMQLLSRRSEEGDKAGLGWIPAETVRFDSAAARRPVPHMGWNTVAPLRDHPLFTGYAESPRFYFAHSYHLVCGDDSIAVGATSYGYEFASVVAWNNIVGVQFHPEKSHRFGMQLFRNFLVGFRSPLPLP